MNLNKLFTILLFFYLPTIFAQSNIIFVKPNATGSGKSWSDATGNLRAALLNAAFGTEIWVSQGIYTPTKCTICNASERQKSFEIPNGVAVFGGFLGTETQRDQRNWRANRTFLSGDIDADGRATSNSYHVIYTQNVGDKMILDGFTVSGGNADSSTTPGERYSSGGAWYNDGRSGQIGSPTVRNCAFTRNFAIAFAGALYNNGGFNGYCYATFENCQFVNNFSRKEGGAIFNSGVFGGICNPTFTFCEFSGNRTEGSGGAIFNDAQKGRCEPIFTNCQFIKNEIVAERYGGAIYNLGKGGKCSPTITGCLFWANKAFSAAAVYCLGSEQGVSSPQITNCIFYKNEANTGGSVYANAGEADVTGASTGESKPVISNSIFWANKALTTRHLRNINGEPTLSFCIVDTTSCAALHGGKGVGVNCGSGMIYNQNPLFVDADNGDFNLLPTSPARDKGSNFLAKNLTLDLAAEPRIINDSIDIGAFEFNPK
ncbi:MAG: hypothetical protein HC817_16660, partial [Saprospiraceae bacterium]|nr:hypothetical protein [Saprospiraceae bacterium]